MPTINRREFLRLTAASVGALVTGQVAAASDQKCYGWTFGLHRTLDRIKCAGGQGRAFATLPVIQPRLAGPTFGFYQSIPTLAANAGRWLA